MFGLGANLGDPADALQQAVNELCGQPGIIGIAVSDIYRTSPVGGPDQPDYLNAILIAAATLEPSDLLRAALAAEAHLKRTREVRWGPRTLDVDIIDVAGVVSTDPDLMLPHPRAHERAFVLVPWLAVEPDAVLSGRNTRVADLVAGLSGQQSVSIWQGATLALPDAPTLGG